MHPECRSFVADAVVALGAYRSVIEIGSRDVNGSIRDLFRGAAQYIGIDPVPGWGVDWVGNAQDFRPSVPVDVVVCCEVLEHTPDGADILAAAASWLAPGGTLITTMAGPGREPHSAVDGGPLRDGEYYRNVTLDELAGWLAGLDVRVLVQDDDAGDLRAVAVCP